MSESGPGPEAPSGQFGLYPGGLPLADGRGKSRASPRVLHKEAAGSARPGAGGGGVQLEVSTARVALIQHTFTKCLLHDSSGEDPALGRGRAHSPGGAGAGGRGRTWNTHPHSVCA